MAGIRRIMDIITYNRPKKAVLLDVDGVLLPCAELAVAKWNKENPHKPPMTIEEITRYGVTGKRTDELLEYYKDESFYHKQKPYPGSQEFVKSLVSRMDVYFLTAVPGNVVDYRIKQIKSFFPEVPSSNIFFGSVKERFIADYSLDDCPEHILAQYDSGAVRHPVIMRRPWNEHLSGIMSVNSYDDFLTFIGIIDPDALYETNVEPPYILTLVGPAGSNKGELCEELIRRGCKRLPSYTTSEEKTDEPQGYIHVSLERFLQMKRDNEFIETTSYAGNYYGIAQKYTTSIPDDESPVVTVVDVCGAVALKRVYGRHCLMAYVKRDYESLLNDLLEKHSGSELTNRLRWLSAEQKNGRLCDITVDNSDIAKSAEALIDFMKKSSK